MLSYGSNYQFFPDPDLPCYQPCFRALYSYIMLLKGWLLRSCPLYAIKNQICHKKPSFCLKFEHFIKKIGENLRYAQLIMCNSCLY